MSKYHKYALMLKGEFYSTKYGMSTIPDDMFETYRIAYQKNKELGSIYSIVQINLHWETK